MRVIRKIKDIHIDKKSILTIGNFDGVHKGHQKIINKVVKEAKTQKVQSVVLTFANHPAVFLNKISPLFLMQNKEKEEFFKRLGVDIVIFLKFTDSLAKKSASDFLKFLFDRIFIFKIVVGENFYFGKGNQGNVDFLREQTSVLDYKFVSVPLLKEKTFFISSSVIRKLILKGDVAQANKLLGYQYSIEAIVVKGKQLGQTLGFPTLNFNMKSLKKVIPSSGVYKTKTQIGKKFYNSFTFINTVEVKPVFETFVLKFDRNIYGQTVRVYFEQFLRKPKKIKNLEELKHQIQLDVYQGGSQHGFY